MIVDRGSSGDHIYVADTGNNRILGFRSYSSTNADLVFGQPDEFRRRGQLVAIGGPYTSLSPATVRPHADILFIGEAEKTWPEFLADFRAGHWQDALAHLQRHHGIGQRMLDGRQVAGRQADIETADHPPHYFQTLRLGQLRHDVDARRAKRFAEFA